MVLVEEIAKERKEEVAVMATMVEVFVMVVWERKKGKKWRWCFWRLK